VGGAGGQTADDVCAIRQCDLSGSEKRAYVHTLSLRLTSEQYRRLRKSVTTHEDKTERRITHQAVLETALADYLDRHQG
jgi:hypothetical protein